VFSLERSSLGVEVILSIPLAPQSGHFGSAMKFSLRSLVSVLQYYTGLAFDASAGKSCLIFA
jgi:hypothetical protein